MSDPMSDPASDPTSRPDVPDVLVTDEPTLARLAEALGVERVVAIDVSAVDYAVPSLTTGGRWWVDLRVDDDRDPGAGVRLFVKLVRSALRSPLLAQVPPQFHAQVAATLPWEVEPTVYRSDLPALLPDGMRAAVPHLVRADGEDGAVLWLEALDVDPTPWTDARYARTARHLGRLAGSAQVAAVADAIGHPVAPHQARAYWEGRLQGQFVAAYADPALWSHPVLAAAFDARLRQRLDALVARVPALLDEVEALPLLAGHGDACPGNVLRARDAGADAEDVVVDWGFFGRHRLGFDLTQLLVSEVELGTGSAADAAGRADALVEAYAAGLADVGAGVDAAALRRAHAVQVALAYGVAAVPLEQLGLTPEALTPLVRQRARLLEHALDGIGL